MTALIGYTARAAALALAAMIFSAPPSQPAAAAGAVYAFGDSLSDAGNLFLRNGGAEPVSPPYSAGRFSNGPTWVEDLAAMLGTAMTPSLSGGNDYAFGGAESGTTALHTATSIDLPRQVAEFTAANPAVTPGAVVALDIGANEIFGILTGHSSQAAASTVLSQTVANVANAISRLAAAGVRRFVVMGVPDLGKTPRILGQSASTGVWASQLSRTYNLLLSQKLVAAAHSTGALIGFVDAFSVLDDVIANPGPFGFTFVSESCWRGNSRSAASSVVCSPVTQVQNEYVFWDGGHPTAHMHEVLAAQALTQVPAASR